jgi:response regulator RpfG family c-di-GMP phosphodiesterase
MSHQITQSKKMKFDTLTPKLFSKAQKQTETNIQYAAKSVPLKPSKTQAVNRNQNSPKLQMEKTKILCVDDEPTVLSGLQLNLSDQYDVHVAEDGKTALEILEKDGPFAVVISDMRMPEMNGAELLHEIEERSPETTRMLLTGYTDFDSAIKAVNDGHIYRFLTKPCPPDMLKKSVKAGIQQYELIHAEHLLLEETLKGAVAALAEVLAISNPLFFGRAQRMKKLASMLSKELNVGKQWEIELAATFSQIGGIMTPIHMKEAIFFDEELSPEEIQVKKGYPKLVDRVLGNVPRLEGVQTILSGFFGKESESKEQDHLFWSTEILKVVHDYDVLEMQGMERHMVIQTLIGRGNKYNSTVITTLTNLIRGLNKSVIVQEVAPDDLHPGMRLEEDLYLNQTNLIASRGTVVDMHFIHIIQNYIKFSVEAEEALPFPTKVKVSVHSSSA